MVLGAALLATAATRSDARADITNYFTGFGWRAPNSFEPKGYDRPGTAANFLIQNTHNWSIFRNMGNLGIGNGSTATFGDPNELPSNYSDYYFQAGDVSQAPLDPARELNLNVAIPAAGENNKAGENDTTAAENATNATVDTGAGRGNSSLNRSLSMPDYFNRNAPGDINGHILNNTSSSADGNASLPAANVTAGEAPGNTTEESESPVAAAGLTPENLTFAAYHPIMVGKPVNDLLYEHPFASPISTYCRLVGLATPSGIPVNIGMRCLSYGY